MAVSLWPHFFGPSCTYLENTPKKIHMVLYHKSEFCRKSILSKRLNESCWVLAWSFLRPIPHCVMKKFGYLQKWSTSLCTFVLNSGLEKNLLRHIDRRNLARQRQTLSVINCTVNGQLSWQYLRRSTASLSQLSSGSVYSTIPSRGSICNSLLSTLIIFGRITISSPQ